VARIQALGKERHGKPWRKSTFRHCHLEEREVAEYPGGMAFEELGPKERELPFQSDELTCKGDIVGPKVRVQTGL